MGLPARHHRALASIENALRESDPRLVSMFVTFSHLTRDEDMPRIEELRAFFVRKVARIRARLARATRWVGQPTRRRLRRVLRTVPLLVPAAAIALIGCAIVFGSGLSNAARCSAISRTVGRPEPSVDPWTSCARDGQPIFVGK